VVFTAINPRSPRVLGQKTGYLCYTVHLYVRAQCSGSSSKCGLLFHKVIIREQRVARERTNFTHSLSEGGEDLRTDGRTALQVRVAKYALSLLCIIKLPPTVIPSFIDQQHYEMNSSYSIMQF
jgi:hypothetical protein